MVIDIKMCRFENVPWGFRLVGGSDFEYPLTVVKVTDGSIAEDAGLRVGDVIVRINDTPASSLAHEDANQIIKHCGNVFYFGVYREDAEFEDMSKQFPIINENERPATPQSFQLEVYNNDINTCKSPVPFEHQMNSAGFYVRVDENKDVVREGEYDEVEGEFKKEVDYLSERPNSVMSENTEIKLVEEEIAAVLSSETEVLKEHNVLGIFPKPGVCMSSDVLRTLNEEATKTKLQMDTEKKKWTTFMQKPDRPIPKSKQQLEAEHRAANAYKVQIVKSRTSPLTPALEKSATLTPEPSKTAEPEPIPEPTLEPLLESCDVQSILEQEEEEDEEPLPTDSEVPNLKEITVNSPIISVTEDDGGIKAEANFKTQDIPEDDDKVSTTDATEDITTNKVIENEDNVECAQTANTADKKTVEEIALEVQLADVQNQLIALASLPSTIQATLDAVTKQLADLLPAFKLQNTPQTSEKVAPKIEETREICLEQDTSPDTENTELEQISNNMEHEEEHNTKKAYDHIIEDDTSDVILEVPTIKTNNNGHFEVEDDPQLKKQKKHDVIQELEVQLERKNKKNRSKRAFGPLTPSSERPLVLPGGRRWYRPKDAFNDEFIAETLSAQAELITGTTLGGSYESPLLGFDPRVNFMKYQKPEKKIDLNRSEVYKVIHHLDRQPVRGIEVRAPVVPAEQDIRKAVQLG